MKPKAKTSLHVLLARDAPVGLVIRRGPSKHVATVGWNRRTDSFQLGQWFKGKIYPQRCDLAPNGEHLIYFALNGKWNSETKGSWTAVSRTPYLKALSLYPQGDTWGGGGLWTDNYKYVVCGNSDKPLRESSYFREDIGPDLILDFGGFSNLYFSRLVRDGWTYDGQQKSKGRGYESLFSKPLPAHWAIKKITLSEMDHDEHELINTDNGTTIACPNWEWADLDGKRLVWATDGKLFAADIKRKGLANEKELYDFSEMKFEAIEAPYDV